MFTRYSGIDIPQNYSGNRFSKRRIEDTEMKIHSTQIQGATKSSVSPSFEGNNINITENEDEIEIVELEDDVPLNMPENDDDAKATEKNQENEATNDTLSVFSQIADYFKKISSDDLLLIALIIFLANDHNVSNNDIIIILALMLIYHA